MQYKNRDVILQDFLFVSILMGNDYLPKLRGASLQSIWKAYVDVAPNWGEGLVNMQGGKININFPFLWNILSKAHGYSRRIKARESHVDVCQRYIEGVVWCFDMYLRGKCNDHGYIYGYQDSPSCMDLILYVGGKKTHKLRRNKRGEIDNSLYGLMLISPQDVEEVCSKRQKRMSKKLRKTNLLRGGKTIDEKTMRKIESCVSEFM